ncbi:hypothetical protein BJ878DRAFT_125483 [Calycina marina]|uniref:SH3 domain-containing protein n=1 Tax=Calycina marina TaxID=1763456 RepID=A0A9P7Z1B6_9HELO|nr:hypothetical protein BJ878DRAFT_125483 [Calycina marina]
MTRPEIIRADSIDLQDHDAPSAKDHTRQLVHPRPLGDGPPAPHQAEALREAAADVQQPKSPRLSSDWSGQQQFGYDSELKSDTLANANLRRQDDLAVAQNGGLTGSIAEDADMADAEGDDGIDDDMMDNISSSPSIDDGGYLLPQQRPQRVTPFARAKSPDIQSTPVSQACSESSSSFQETPDRQPLQPRREDVVEEVVSVEQVLKYHHLPGEYPDSDDDNASQYNSDHQDQIISPDPLQNSEPAQSYDDDASHYDSEYQDRTMSPLPLENGEPTESYDDDVSHYDSDSQDGTAPPVPLQGGEPTESYDEYYDLEDSAEMELLLDLELNDDGNFSDIDKAKSLHDGSAMLRVPYESSEDEDDDDYEFPTVPIDRFTDSGWGGECLQELEDIDFEFVYALHTFVATVEGQANATKGDTMVLLDDSNSYWWLVRVVKDSSIGYLPAEHIETPTERLARLNKHRNIDLTSAMLGDQGEKTKNPLKKVIRRRNAKTVTFAPPTYVEASDVDYSTDEEDGEGEGLDLSERQEQAAAQEEQQRPDEDEITATEPLKMKSDVREVKPDSMDSERTTSSDMKRDSDDVYDGKLENSKSRNGTVRNTDSFFRDDSVETRKITLTPNLLRDDSSTSTRASGDSKEFQKRPSFEKLEKDSPDKDKRATKEKKDKERKDKEKKPGMLSGLFKRKDKKTKLGSLDEDDESLGKRSTDKDRGSSPAPSKDSEEAATYVTNLEDVSAQEVQRSPSKLQKSPRSDMSPVRKLEQMPTRSIDAPQDIVTQQTPAPERPLPATSLPAPSMRLVEPDNGSEETLKQPVQNPNDTPGPTPVLAAPKESKPAGIISKSPLAINTNGSESKPVRVTQAKSRAVMDDFDTSEDDSPVEKVYRAPSKQNQRPIPGSFPESYIGTPQVERPNVLEKSNQVEDRLSESPVEVSPITPPQSYLPSLMVENLNRENVPSPVSSPSPDIIDGEEARENKSIATASTSTATWSDAHLRTFFDDDSDIKDLLVVVYDKSGVVPAGPDHPITGNLFREENAKLADITTSG